jgi:predicted nucleic acid-binding protein
MPKRKNKIIYVDTCVIIDYFADKETNAVVMMKSVKTRGWRLRTSTFAMIELAEYRRNEIYLWDKLSQKKSLNSVVKKIRNPRTNKKLKDHQLIRVAEWLEELEKNLPNIGFLDLEPSKDKDTDSGWDLAHYISKYSNLNSKDVIHLASALASAINDDCDFFITNDGDLSKETNKFLKEYKLTRTLKVFSPKQFVDKYPPLKIQRKKK